MKTIAIVGGGFCGNLTATQLVEKAEQPLKIVLINWANQPGLGVAYSTYSKKQLLNVPAGKMSAFAHEPNHFLDFVCKQSVYKEIDRALLANAFLPRHIYGLYLAEILTNTKKKAAQKGIVLEILSAEVGNISCEDGSYKLQLNNAGHILANQCVLATGNLLPRNPKISNPNFYTDARYHQNPWNLNSVNQTKSNYPVLIIGNGLTMVDTVLGLQEFGFRGDIVSLSPNGFNILPHRHGGLAYTKLKEELKPKMSLYQLFTLVHKHIKTVRQFGLSAEPVIDSLRAETPRIWQELSLADKKLFMSRFRHRWGVARHRIPMQIHDKIQELRIAKKLQIFSGRLQNLESFNDFVEASFIEKGTQKMTKIRVSSVINCTGPETDLRNVESGLLHELYKNGTIMQDELYLGISTHLASFQVINAKNTIQNNLYTLGGNLKGQLWESTAVPELRLQTEKLAEELLRIYPNARPCST